MEKKKYYVVLKGVEPGVYASWDECRRQVDGVKGACYKSFDTMETASAAYANGFVARVGPSGAGRNVCVASTGDFIRNSLAVDAACSGNPGAMEYRGVYVGDGREIFRVGPYCAGTNNVGEFLAVVHGLALLKLRNSEIPIYTDSVNAMLWVKNKKCKTKLVPCAANEGLFEVVARAEKWLQNNTYTTEILKWETKKWGEIPADFGRKK